MPVGGNVRVHGNRLQHSRALSGSDNQCMDKLAFIAASRWCQHGAGADSLGPFLCFCQLKQSFRVFGVYLAVILPSVLRSGAHLRAQVGGKEHSGESSFQICHHRAGY